MKNVGSCPFAWCDKGAGVEEDEDSEEAVEYEEDAVAGGGGILSNPSKNHDVALPDTLPVRVEEGVKEKSPRPEDGVVNEEVEEVAEDVRDVWRGGR